VQAEIRTAGTTPATGHKRGLLARAANEVRRFVVMFLYLWALFALFVLDGSVILREQSFNFVPHGFAIFNALVLAKVMLLAENLDLGRWLKRRPLIYPILHETILLTILFIAFHVVEKIVIGVIHGETAAASVPGFGGGGWFGLLCVALILFLSLLPFFAFRNIAREIGAERMRAMLFGTTFLASE
jgi:hypothetical protein